MGRPKSRANGDGDVWPVRDESGKVVRYAGSFYADTPRGRKRVYASAKTAKEARRRLAQKKPPPSLTVGWSSTPRIEPSSST